MSGYGLTVRPPDTVVKMSWRKGTHRIYYDDGAIYTTIDIPAS